jgi:hypothetical protein
MNFNEGGKIKIFGGNLVRGGLAIEHNVLRIKEVAEDNLGGA